VVHWLLHGRALDAPGAHPNRDAECANGIAVQAAAADEHRITLEAVCPQHSDVVETEIGRLLAVAQQERNGTLVDTEDRGPETCVVPAGSRRCRPVTCSTAKSHFVVVASAGTGSSALLSDDRCASVRDTGVWGWAA